MSVKNRRYTFRRKKNKTHTQELAHRLAPLEEMQESAKLQQAVPNGKPASGVDDTIRVDSSSIKLPEKIVEEEREGFDIFHPDPIVVWIAGLLLAFIAFIAWQITRMPVK